ncbi:MAG: dihydroorotase, partial [Mycoplasmatales bacterium]
MSRLIIKNAKLVDNSIVEIFIEEDLIVGINNNIFNSKNVLDAKGFNVFPGFIDVHTHVREPGLEEKEDIISVSNAALRGGYTHIFAMPNSKPPIDTIDAYNNFQNLINEKAKVNISIVPALTKGLVTEELVDYQALNKLGAPAFSNDGRGIQNKALVRKIMETINNVYVSHAELDHLVKGGVIHEGIKDKEFGLQGICSASEYEAVRQEADVATELGCQYHVCHISTKETIEIIRNYGDNITGEITPHHLLLSEQDITLNHGMFKMNPPLRSVEDKETLQQAIVDGTINIIATDHAPHKEEEKECDFNKAYFGIVGLETA